MQRQSYWEAPRHPGPRQQGWGTLQSPAQAPQVPRAQVGVGPMQRDPFPKEEANAGAKPEEWWPLSFLVCKTG